MPETAERERTWVEKEHPEFTKLKTRWGYAHAMYTADMLADDSIERYLIRKTGETLEAFKERRAMADYTNHLGVVVDSLAGMLFQKEGDANRAWADEDGKGLGRIEDERSVAHRLWNDANGRGENWLTVWKVFATQLTLLQRYYVVIDSPDGDAIVRILPPWSVPNWLEGKEAIVKERHDKRKSLEDDPKDSIIERFVRYELEGWTRYEVREGEGGEKTAVPVAGYRAGEQEDGDSAQDGRKPGSYAFKDRNGRPTLPIYRIDLPLGRMLGWYLAKKAAAMFNMESGRDNLLRTANFPFLELVANDTLFKETVDKIQKGWRAIQRDPNATGGHGFIAPPEGPASVATEVLEKKAREFYLTAFREYGDSARERTATEVRQDVASGVAAFLTLLKAAVDDAENNALWLISQVENPDKESTWGIPFVARTDDFAPSDINLVIERMTNRYFGKDIPVPVGRSGLISVAEQIATWDGVTVDRSELAAAVDSHVLRGALTSMRELPIPTEPKAEMAVRQLEAMGYVEFERDERGELTEAGRAERERILANALGIAQEMEQGNRLMAQGGFPLG